MHELLKGRFSHGQNRTTMGDAPEYSQLTTMRRRGQVRVANGHVAELWWTNWGLSQSLLEENIGRCLFYGRAS